MDWKCLKSREVRIISNDSVLEKGLPREALSAGLTTNLSVIFNTHYSEFAGGFFFDHDLVLEVLGCLMWGSFSSEFRIEGRTLNFKQLREYWVQGWESELHKNDPSQNDLFEVAKLYDDTNIYIYIVGKKFYAAGGLLPYADSATLELYCRPSEKSRIINQLSQCFKNNHCRSNI